MNFTFALFVFLAFAAISELFTQCITQKTPVWYLGTIFRVAVIALGFAIIFGLRQESEFLQKENDLQTERYEQLNHVYDLYNTAVISYSNYLWEKNDTFMVDFADEIAAQELKLDSINNEYDLCIK